MSVITEESAQIGADEPKQATPSARRKRPASTLR